jgi:ATP sulfurylase
MFRTRVGWLQVLFHAKSRRNAGATYFVAGRDPAGMKGSSLAQAHPDDDLYDGNHGRCVMRDTHRPALLPALLPAPHLVVLAERSEMCGVRVQVVSVLTICALLLPVHCPLPGTC